jgi:endonuclease G
MNFYRSGYDRGHLAPAADHRSSEDRMRNTFNLCNVAPQVGDGFNRHYWARLESFVRHLTSRFDDVYVATGLLYMPQNINTLKDESTESFDDKSSNDTSQTVVQYQMIGNPPNVAVPTHFYKIVLAKNRTTDTMSLGCFVMPNAAIEESTPLTSFWTPLPLLERWSGIQFFPQLRSTDTQLIPLNNSFDGDQYSFRELHPHTQERFTTNLCSLCELDGSCELPPPYVPRK